MRRIQWIVVLLVLLGAAAIRIRLLQTPLERDEGEYAYAGQLILQGVPPYLLAANMKLPGTYAAYALIMGLFGQSIAAIHAGLLLVNAGAAILVFLIGRRLSSIGAGCVACASYALMSLGSSVIGTQGHATQFVIFFALGGTLLLLRFLATSRNWELFGSGLLFGLAFLMKQPGLVFAAFGAAWLVYSDGTGRTLLRRLALFSAAAATPFAATCLILWRAGVFPKFWFEVFTYARLYAMESSLGDGLIAIEDNFPPVFLQNFGIWILAAVGLALSLRKREYFGAWFLAFSTLAVCPGLYFREHYFVLMLPAIALLAGACVDLSSGVFRSRIPYWVFGAALCGSLIVQREFLFFMTPMQACRELYETNPFPEAIRVGAYLREHSDPSARVAVLGSEPEIYFYAQRRSATSNLYTYPMMENQPYALTMQNQMIREVEAVSPEYVVQVVGRESWLTEPRSPRRIFDWWSEYGPRHYRMVGIANIVDEAHTEYRWDAEAESYAARSAHYLAIFRRIG